MTENETKTIDREVLICILRDLNTIVVSLDRIGSCASDLTEEQYNATMTQFIQDWRVFRRLAGIRQTLSDLFSRELGDDDMEELERELQGLEYWTSPKNL